ncbi:MAG: OmpH family outer membrane protein, partial [Acidobacteria bacterium]|nr:OmpH family outer membrane protein [Acidobacteriota bacterium]
DGHAQTVATTESSREAQTDPGDTRIAVVNIQQVAAESVTGKALAGRVDALNQQKASELNQRRKALEAAQQKLESAASVLNPNALAQLQKDIERQQIDLQRFTEDAQADIQDLQAQVQNEFEARLTPILEEVARERGLHLLFSLVDSGLVWADPSLDVTSEVIKKLDAR